MWFYHCKSDLHFTHGHLGVLLQVQLYARQCAWLHSRSLTARWMAMNMLDIILMAVKSTSLSGWSFLPVWNFLAHVSRAPYESAQFEQGLVFLSWSSDILQFLYSVSRWLFWTSFMSGLSPFLSMRCHDYPGLFWVMTNVESVHPSGPDKWTLHTRYSLNNVV